MNRRPVSPRLPTRRLLRVWQRNWLVYRQTWLISFLPPLLEPCFYLLAFGIGLAQMVGPVISSAGTISYTAFIAPALVAINIMQSAFFETTYASFVRMYYQKTFAAMLATPLTLEEIITGEILWGATKAVIGSALMLIVISCFGLFHFPSALLLLPAALLGGLAFACAGMVFTAIVPAIETFNLPVFLFITPMFLFSGTFFPLDNLPAWAQFVAQLLPLTHVVELCRAAGLGHPLPATAPALAYLTLWCLILFPLALIAMRRRLIH
ncbi:MAG: ABC transporter permease [Desulfuromonadales bacterium GWD2_61_12]|nr:MAG: ABC transporter permease [Desulfuromonadales bacterium GWC2_61_20]OGR33945.1 MAG: ABC transporter permease [Desulfuromonadales bacterium GWD2_61_12]HAD05140.1 ABC transporter permease [Desulfuromonas sp.]HBT82731.1 ABC transporter permease [Desulfuromonas sp.]